MKKWGNLHTFRTYHYTANRTAKVKKWQKHRGEKDVEKWVPHTSLVTVWRGTATVEKNGSVFQAQMQDRALTLQGIHSREMKQAHTETCPWRFTAALFIILKNCDRSSQGSLPRGKAHPHHRPHSAVPTHASTRRGLQGMLLSEKAHHTCYMTDLGTTVVAARVHGRGRAKEVGAARKGSCPVPRLWQ